MSHTLDGRKISHEALEEIRMRAVQRVEAGESPEEVVAALGLHRSVIYKWLNIYRRGGFEALKSRKAPGARPKLSTTQQNQLIELLTCYSPLELGFEYALWAQAMVRELLKKEFNVTMTRPAVGQMLHRLGFSPQRPLARAYQRDEERVQTWKQQAYPEFRREARAQRATIYFADESTIRSDAHSARPGRRSVRRPSWSVPGHASA